MRKSILTVTTPPASALLTDVATVMAELGINASETRNIARWIKQASGAITRYCKRQLVQQSVTEQFRPDRRVVITNMTIDSPTHIRLRLRMYPVTEIASVTEDGTVLDPSSYEVDPETGLLSRLYGDMPRQWMAAKILVAYTGGYVLPPDPAADLPDEISDAAIQLVKLMRFGAKRDPLVKSQTVVGVLEQDFWVGPMAGTDGSSMPASIGSLLDAFVAEDL